jgi:hypothetical protein
VKANARPGGMALAAPRVGSWAPPVWYHTAQSGTIYTYGANAIATGLLTGIAILSGWIIGLLFRPNTRPVLMVFSCTVLLSWIFYNASLGDDAGARLPWSLYFWMNGILQAVGILAGGLRVDPGLSRPARSRQ